MSPWYLQKTAFAQRNIHWKSQSTKIRNTLPKKKKKKVSGLKRLAYNWQHLNKLGHTSKLDSIPKMCIILIYLHFALDFLWTILLTFKMVLLSKWKKMRKSSLVDILLCHLPKGISKRTPFLYINTFQELYLQSSI